jgi:hypothetical protein
MLLALLVTPRLPVVALLVVLEQVVLEMVEVSDVLLLRLYLEVQLCDLIVRLLRDAVQ